MNIKLINALEARYKARKEEAVGTLSVYFNNAAGIGEHPQIIDEMDKQVEQFANADDCLKAIEEIKLRAGD